MLSDIISAIFRQRSENGTFCAKREALIIKTLHRNGFVKKAEKAVIALRNRPRCNAKRPLRECREALTAR